MLLAGVTWWSNETLGVLKGEDIPGVYLVRAVFVCQPQELIGERIEGLVSKLVPNLAKQRQISAGHERVSSEPESGVFIRVAVGFFRQDRYI